MHKVADCVVLISNSLIDKPDCVTFNMTCQSGAAWQEMPRLLFVASPLLYNDCIVVLCVVHMLIFNCEHLTQYRSLHNPAVNSSLYDTYRIDMATVSNGPVNVNMQSLLNLC